MEVITRKEGKERGLKRYFTGKPCKHGHVTERAVPDGGCVECKRLRVRAYKQTEKSKTHMRAYNQTEKRKACMRAYNQTEERKAYMRTYNQTEERKAYMRVYERTENGVKRDLKKKLGFDPPESLVKSTWGVRSLKRIIKQAKETQTQTQTQ